MLDVHSYVVDGRVAREKIAMDVKYRNLNRTDLEHLAVNPDIQRAFIGDRYSDKVPKNQWTKDYLDELSYAVVGESFNKDYLLYLDEVAEYVSKKKNNGKIIAGAIILLAAAAALTFVIVK